MSATILTVTEVVGPAVARKCYFLCLLLDAGPTHSEPCYPYPPILSVKPSNGSVKRGDTLSFHCSLPPPRPQSNADNRPVSFTLLRAVAAETKGMASIIPQPQFSQVSISEPQPGVFSVGPVTGGEQGQYCCIYQIRSRGGLVNSSVSNMVYVTVTGKDFCNIDLS